MSAIPPSPSIRPTPSPQPPVSKEVPPRDPETKPKITTIGGSNTGGDKSIESAWKRPPNKVGGGATHVRTFTAKMNSSGLEHLDRHINEWLDNHPDAEVKFSTLQVGEMATSIGKESVLVVQVWI